MVKVISRAMIYPQKIIKPHLNITYPKVAGLRDRRLEKKINDQIFQFVYEMIRKQVYDQTTETMLGTYEVMLNELGLVSVQLENYTYHKHAAHGLTLRRSPTFDLVTGYMYSLPDLFKENSHYVERLSEIVKRQIAEKDIPTLEPFMQISPNQDFYLTPKALVLYYQVYELAAYVYGFPSFEIHYKEIESLIDPKGPIARLL